MIKIALVCRFGASTSLLASKIQKEATSKGLELECAAYPEDIIKEVIAQNDVVLIGPQIQYRIEEIKKEVGDGASKFILVSPQDFGMMNASHLLEVSLEKIEELKK